MTMKITTTNENEVNELSATELALIVETKATIDCGIKADKVTANCLQDTANKLTQIIEMEIAKLETNQGNVTLVSDIVKGSTLSRKLNKILKGLVLGSTPAEASEHHYKNALRLVQYRTESDKAPYVFTSDEAINVSRAIAASGVEFEVLKGLFSKCSKEGLEALQALSKKSIDLDDRLAQWKKLDEQFNNELNSKSIDVKKLESIQKEKEILMEGIEVLRKEVTNN